MKRQVAQPLDSSLKKKLHCLFEGLGMTLHVQKAFGLMVNHQGYQHQQTPKRRQEADQKYTEEDEKRWAGQRRESWRTSERLGYQFTESCPSQASHLVLMRKWGEPLLPWSPSHTLELPEQGGVLSEELFPATALCNPGPRALFEGKSSGVSNDHHCDPAVCLLGTSKIHTKLPNRKAAILNVWSSFINVCQIPQSLFLNHSFYDNSI